jgi:hypothetical protein
MQNKVSKKAWVAMFQEIGLTDETMMKWHRVFETHHPEGHVDFLAWLGISPDEIKEIRGQCL